MDWSQLLEDFVLGAVLGDKESEDWALAMLWPGLAGEREQETRPPGPGSGDTAAGRPEMSPGAGPGGYGMELLSAPSGAGVERLFAAARARRGGGQARGRRGVRRRGGPSQRGAGRRSPQPGMGGDREPGQASDGDDRAWWSPGYVLRDTVTPGGPATAERRPDVPLLEWCAPAQPVDAELYNTYLNTHGRAQYKPGGERKRWHEFTDPFHARVAWYVWHGIPQEEAEERLSSADVHQRELDKLEASQEQWRRYAWGKLAGSMGMFRPDEPALPTGGPPPEPPPPAPTQRQQDLLRIRHAIESIGRMARSGHPEYLPYYLVARATPIKIVSWAGVDADAQTNPFYDAIYLGRGIVTNQADLVTQIMHEIQHVYDWHWRFRIRRPLHDVEDRATPLESAAGQDYIDFVWRGDISEEALPAEVRQPVGPKEPEP